MAAMTGRAPKRAESPLKGFHKGASAKERLTALGRLMNNGSKEAMLLDEEEMRVQGPSRRREDSRGVKRRGSETDAYRPARCLTLPPTLSHTLITMYTLYTHTMHRMTPLTRPPTSPSNITITPLP